MASRWERVTFVMKGERKKTKVEKKDKEGKVIPKEILSAKDVQPSS